MRLILSLLLLLLSSQVFAQGVDSATRQLAFEDYWAGRLDEAKKGFSLVLAANPDDAEATLAMARMAYWSGDTTTGIPLYERYLKAQPYDLDAKTEYCRCLSWEGRSQETEACASSVVAVERENLEANLILASALRANGKQRQSDEVVRWVLTLDPTNQEARNLPVMAVAAQPAPQPAAPAPAGRASAATPAAPAVTQAPEQPAAAEGQLRYRPHAEGSYEGDNFDYRGFRALLGFTAPLTETVTLDPRIIFLAASDPRTTEPVTGFGAGLQAIWQAAPAVSFTAQGHYVPVTSQLGVADAWDLGLVAQFGVAEGFNLWLGALTVLHGTDRQSAEAMVQEIRRNELQGGLYYENQRWRFIASGTYGFLRAPKADPTIGSTDYGSTSTWYLSPALKLPVPQVDLAVGYALWGTYYRKEAPNFAWWSPALYFSHSLFVEAAIPMDQQWTVQATVAGGLGQEQRREVPGQLSSYWQSAGIGNGSLTLVYKAGETFDLSFGGAFGLSSRQNRKTTTVIPATVPGGIDTVVTTGGDVSTYQNWQLFFNAGGRF